jgi:hypothetical protein
MHFVEPRTGYWTQHGEIVSNDIFQGWIACGGEAGLLKVLKLETSSGPDARIMVHILIILFDIL